MKALEQLVLKYLFNVKYSIRKTLEQTNLLDTNNEQAIYNYRTINKLDVIIWGPPAMLGAAQGSIQRGFVKCTQLIVCHKDNTHLQARTGISHLSLNSERSGTEEHLTRQLRNMI